MQQQKESRTHGTALFPFHVYSHTAIDHYFVFYHWHEEVELIYVEQGVMNIIVNSISYHLHAGDIIFIDSGSLHQIQSDVTSVHHAIVFHPKLLDFQSYDAVQDKVLTPLREGKLHYPVQCSLQDEIRNKIMNHLLSLIHLGHEESVSAMLKIKINLLEMISLLYENQLFLHENYQERKTQNLENIKLVVAYMLKHFAEKISLHELSSLLNMNQNYFCRYFKKHTGLTPLVYLLQMRIEESAKLLTTTDLKIIEIALCCGFDNCSYFIRKFNEYKGVTPSQYRTAAHSFT